MKLYTSIVLSVLFVCSLCVSGAKSSQDFYYLNTKTGLESNAVAAIKKDSAGFIWIGTKKGLARYDGVETCNYPLIPGHDNVWAIEEADNDTLLIGTLSDVIFYSRKSRTCVPLGLPEAVVKVIYKISPSRFWVGTENGLYLVENHKYRRIHLGSGLSTANHITGLLRQDKDIFWFSTADGLLRIDLRNKKPVLYRMPGNSNFFTCLTGDGKTIFVGTFNKGIFKFNIESGTFDKVNGFDYNLIMDIDYDDHKLYIGTNGQGLKSLDLNNGSIEAIPLDQDRHNNYDTNTVTCIHRDNGIMWVGTQFGGLAYTPRNDYLFKHYGIPGFNSSDYHIRSLRTLDDGSRLIGTREGLFYIDRKSGYVKSFKAHDPSSGLRSDIIVSIDRIKGKIMISTFGGGAKVFDPVTHSLHDFSAEDVYIYGCIFGITEDRRGNIWVATQNGLYECSPEGKVLREFNLMNSVLTTNVIFVAHPDKSDRIWIGTNFGLYLLDTLKGHMTNDCFSEPIKGEIKYITEDSRGDIWVGTTQDGLYRIGMNLEVKNHYTTNDFLPENDILSIAEDNRGQLWISTRSRITRFNPADGTSYVFKRRDGLNDLDFNNSVEITGDSIIAWPSEGGLIYTSLNQSGDRPAISTTPRITAVVIGDRVYDPLYLNPHEDIVVSPSDHSVTFKFSNMCFTLPYATAYEYRLEGHDKEWIPITGVNEITYSNLKAGDYVFNLRIPGQDSIAAVPVRIHVARSYSFIIAMTAIILAVLMVTVYYCYRIWRLKIKITNERSLFSKVSENMESDDSAATVRDQNNPLMESLLEYMDSEKPYKNPKLSISDVAAHIGCQEKDLSLLLNSEMKVNFSNFINIYRVNDVKRKLTKESLSRYTLMTIAEQSGFSSKTTFYRVFKDVTGHTPLQYCQQEGLTDGQGSDK